MSASFKIVTSGFEKASKELEKNVERNIGTYAQTLANEFVSLARDTAGYKNRRGVARSGYRGMVEKSASSTTIYMGASAPNYKRGAMSYADYMELLEFDHGGKFASVYPAAHAIGDSVQENFADAALHGRFSVKISRDKAAAARRGKRRRMK